MDFQLRKWSIWFVLTTLTSAVSLWYILTIRLPRSIETRPALRVVGPYDAIFSDLAVDWLFYEYQTLSSIGLVILIGIGMTYIATEIESYL